jgi:hypothetical protein
VKVEKKVGLDELRRTAEKGRYLNPTPRCCWDLPPFAEMQEEVARQEFTDLAIEFPANPLFCFGARAVEAWSFAHHEYPVSLGRHPTPRTRDKEYSDNHGIVKL